MKHRPIALAKSIFLTILVLVSLLLSYWLWVGNFENATEVGFTESFSIPPTTTPALPQVSAPYREVLAVQSAAEVSVAQPGSPTYALWLNQLRTLDVSELQPVATFPEKTTLQVEYDFGTPLTYDLLEYWLPHLNASALANYDGTVLLFQTKANGPVYLGLSSDGSNYEGKTNINGVQMAAILQGETRTTPWSVWMTENRTSYIPAGGQVWTASTWDLEEEPVLPIVHSFFVNPQVLTRIQENPTTVLWTDGSRAVQWSQVSDTLLYQDPNAATVHSTSQSALSMATRFLQDHGGGPSTSYAFQTDSAMSNEETVRFVPYVDGLPIAGVNYEYQVTIRNNRVASIERPLNVRGTELKSEQHPVLDNWKLLAVLKEHMTKTTIQSIASIKLALYPEVKGSVLHLQPAYFLRLSGGRTWVVDAFNGRILKGVGQ
jgi:regulatory protein YycH of two-component signal transduction system YycFG